MNVLMRRLAFVAIYIAIALAALGGAVMADVVIVESRTSAGGETSNPPYSDSGFADSQGHSTGVEGLSATASRYSYGTPTVTITPTLATPGGTYRVEVSHTDQNCSADITVQVALTNCTTSLISGVTAYQSANANKWAYVGTITLNPGQTTPVLRFSKTSGSLSGSARMYSEGYRFSLVSTPVNLSLNACTGGTVSSVPAAGSVPSFTSVTATATPSSGYVFTNWTMDGCGGSAIVSTNPSYTFIMPAQDYSLYANFTPGYVVSAAASPLPAGSVTGVGTFVPGATCTLTATPATGYGFSRWTRDGAGSNLASTANPYSFVVNATSVLYAQFTLNSYSLTRTACSGGSVTGSSGSIPYGNTVSVTATPYPGYCFVGWTTDACGGTAYVCRNATYSFVMPAYPITLYANFAKALLVENFESYATGGVSFDSVDKNDPVGPNQAANGSGNPWWGPNAPNGRVNPNNSHWGSQCLWGTAGNCHDFINLAYRLNNGLPFAGNVYLDWWFYDPLGTGGTSTDFCGDYTALSYYTAIPMSTDYLSPVPDQMNAPIQQLALGMSDDLATGYIPTKYQARIIGDQSGYHNGWINTSVTRSEGWHHARVIVGEPKSGGANSVAFFIDDMSTPATAVRDAITTNGYNILEVNTIMPAAGSCNSASGCRYSKYFHYSAVDDISVGTTLAAPGAASATAGVDRITWNWIDNSNGEESFRIWSSTTSATPVATAASGATAFTETGLAANTQYARWVSAYKNEYSGEMETVRIALPPVHTLALAPAYGSTISCDRGQTSTLAIGTPITFTSINGFGAGPSKTSSYAYIWNASAATPGDWSSAAQWTAGSLIVQPASAGTYYMHLRACNGDGVANPATLNLGPYAYVPPKVLQRISDGWSLDEGTMVTVTAKVTATEPGASFWIEQNDRTSAIRVAYQPTTATLQDHAVTVTGTLTSGTPRSISASSVADLGLALPKIKPLEMIARAVGGTRFNAKTPGATLGVGLYNVGLLVKVAGKVSFADNSNPAARFFYLDDGSPVSSNGHTGIKVNCGTAAAPASGFVKVVGIVSLEQVGGEYVPILLMVSAE